MRSVKVICSVLFAAAVSTVYSQTLSINDTFDDNRNSWWLDKNDVGSQTIKDGKLITETPENGWLLSIRPYVAFEKDFKMEASITQVSGIETNGYGLLWGYSKGGNDENYFIVSPGYFYIANLTAERGKKIKGLNEWVKTDLIKPLGQANLLKIEQVNKTLAFYINNQKVFTTPAFRWAGQEIGIASFAKMKIETDDFKFQQDNVVINLPANLTKGFIKENLGPSVNSVADDLMPLITSDGSQLYFGREYFSGNMGGEKDGEDMYFSSFDGKSWSTAQNLGSPINDPEVNNVISISTDKNTVLFATDTKFKTRTRNGSAWGETKEIGLSFVNTAKNFEACLSADGKAIILAAKNSNNLFINKDDDDRDLFVSLQDQSGKWSQPFNLGPKINSRSKELSPFLAADGRTLYFSSMGRPGYGDTDIFMSKRIGEGWNKWSEPVNLGPEINSPDFDAYYVVPASGEYAYMVSNLTSIGKSDIIRIKIAKEIQPDPVVLVRGKTLDAKTQQPIGATILIDNLTTRKEVGEAISDPKTGDFQIVLPYGANYGFHGAATSHLSVNENLELLTISKYTEVEKNLYLLPIEQGQSLQLNNVFFEQAKPILKPESFPELDRLVTIMKENPTMEIELGGYTDNVGNQTSLIALSMDRAGIVKKYMVEKGIPSKRITGKGYGPANPVVKNDTEEHRRMNRRVEFKITKK